MNVTIVGCGLVGSSWALVFARAGHTVTIYDRSRAAAVAARDFVTAADSVAGARCRTDDDVLAALADADYVQESAPEQLPLKQALYRDMAEGLREHAIVASSTSGFPASSFTEGLSYRARCLVAHPINPPHLIPVVELVPAPWTATTTLDAVRELMYAVGQQPITLSREIDGFVVNRLQSALLNEAFRLVEDGICSPADVDAAIADGLGLRWCFIGPFATIDLNAAGGVADYCAKFGAMYTKLAQEQADPRQWRADLVSSIEAQLRQTVAAADLPARRAWRDRFLAAVVAAKQSIEKELDHE